MTTAIKIDQTDDVKIKVLEISTLLKNIDQTKFGDEVAITALNLLGKSFSNPINVSGCSVADNSTHKYYKGSLKDNKWE